jgi:hypothetical protein
MKIGVHFNLISSPIYAIPLLRVIFGDCEARFSFLLAEGLCDD